MSKFIIGLVLFSGYFMFAFSWVLGDIYIGSMGYSATEVGESTSTLNIVKMLANLVGGVLIGKVLAEKVFKFNVYGFMLGMITIAAGLIVASMTEAFALLLISRALVGLGGGMILFTLSPITASVFEGKALSLVNGTNSSAYSGGIAVASALGVMIATHTIDVIHVTVGILVLLAVVLFLAKLNVQPLVPEGSNGEEQKPASLKQAVMTPFNWIFMLTFTAAIVFFTLMFTFASKMNIEATPFLWAAVGGNVVGIILGGSFPHKKVATISSIIAAIAGVAFFMGGIPSAALVCGFALFAGIPSYITLAFNQSWATPASLGTTFMMLWIGSDSIVAATSISFPSLIGSPASNLVLVALLAMYATGTAVIAKKY
ncbi:MFS transporter [Vibrio superstes]|uniref:MFS transporter n=1 Tax=Vibrio superstes NBRC 103154 TaxID=1219062 RepID=A0A511QP32_9VIBR|nr:MFS transporter [Vibrio superstes]GEM79070.1 hypothetical protein VSU01S_13150 [Vibrio superstes NBRC 103154]